MIDVIDLMIRLDESKLAKLHDVDEKLDRKYGLPGTPEREDFDAKSIAWYYGEILRDRRKELKITQQELAEKVGKETGYIARVEKGEIDIRLSCFMRIIHALKLELKLTREGIDI